MSLVCRLRWWCCGGGRWRCRGSRTAVPNNGYCFERTAVLLFFSSFLPVSSFSLLSLCFSPFFFPSLSSLRLFFFPLFFFVFCPLSCLCSPVFFRFLSSRFLSSLHSHSTSPRFKLPSPFSFKKSPLFFSFLLLLSRFPPPSPWFSPLLLPSLPSWVLFIEPRAWLFTVLMGSSRLVGHWARLPRFGSPRFSGRCVVGGRPVCSVGGLQAREGPAKFKQKLLFPSSPLHVRGGRRKRNSVIQNDTVLLFFF